MTRQKHFGILTAAALAGLLALPLTAQTSSSAAAPAASAPTADASVNAAAAPAASASTAQAQPEAPLAAPVRQGFWGRMNPFARKKYVQGQLQPIRDRVNELDGLTADNTKAIADVDARAKAGIAAANEKAQQAADTANAAEQQVQQDTTQASQLNTQLGDENTKLQSSDQYQVAQKAELHFSPGPAKLDASTQDQLNTFLQGLSGQTGYVVEVTAYSSRKGAAGVTASQDLADTVVRYMVEQQNVPLFRIYNMGMGTATPAASPDTTEGAPTAGGTVDVSILKSSLAGSGAASPAENSNPNS